MVYNQYIDILYKNKYGKVTKLILLLYFPSLNLEPNLKKSKVTEQTNKCILSVLIGKPLKHSNLQR